MAFDLTAGGTYEGWRVRQSNHNEVYLILDGVLCHIPDKPTYDKLWDNFPSGIVEIVNNVSTLPQGSPLSIGTFLTRGAGAGSTAVYLITNRKKRHVTSTTVLATFGWVDAKVFTIPNDILDDISVGAGIN